MRTLLFALLTFAAFNSRAQTLPIDSFYTPGATWVEYTYYIFGLGMSEIDGQSYTIQHDSVIHGLNYHLLSGRFIGSMRGQEEAGGVIDTIYNTHDTDQGIIGGIRVAGQQVYFIQLSSTLPPDYQGFALDTEKLVYDYSIAPLDSVAWQTYNTTYGLKNVLQYTDTLPLTASISARRFVFDTSEYLTFGNNYWVEGIGSSHGMLGSHTAPYWANYISTRLLCYSNASFSYHFPNTLPPMIADSCFDLSTVALFAGNRASSKDLTLYPNPVVDDYISFEGVRLADVTSLVISDVTGRKVQAIEHPFANGNTRIPIALGSGIYIVRIIFSDNTTCTWKIIRY